MAHHLLALPTAAFCLRRRHWSHGLLSTPEQRVFRRLGVFVGGFALGLAQALARDDITDEWAVPDTLGGLVDKSLVIADPADAAEPPRYRLLETTRAYALEMLLAGASAPAFNNESFTVETLDRLLSLRPRIDHRVQPSRAALLWNSLAGLGQSGRMPLAIALDAGVDPPGTRRARGRPGRMPAVARRDAGRQGRNAQPDRRRKRSHPVPLPDGAPRRMHRAGSTAARQLPYEPY